MMEIEQIIKYRAKMRRLDDADKAASERVIRHRSGGKPKQPLISEEERSKCGRILVGADVVDHNGKRFNSLNEMAAFYDIQPPTLRHRLRSGHYTVEQALTCMKRAPVTRTEPLRDHEGTVYGSLFEMAVDWDVDIGTLRARLRKGWTIERALTVKGRRRQEVK
jgi:hypothetical protein